MYKLHHIRFFIIIALLAFSASAWAQTPADTTQKKAISGLRGAPRDTSKTLVTYTDTTPKKNVAVDTGKVKSVVVVDTTKKVKKHSPGKATLMSALLPGLGQVYNRHWWKVPIIYAGFGGVIYGITFNTKYLNDYRSALKTRLGGGQDPYINKYTNANLIELQDYYRRNRDLCYVILAGVYVLNILDANVSAHLYDFDVSDDLSLRVQPGILTAGGGQTVPALSLALRFK